MDQKEEIEKEITNRFINLSNQGVVLVFYDNTSTYFEGERSITVDGIREYGYSETIVLQKNYKFHPNG